MTEIPSLSLLTIVKREPIQAPRKRGRPKGSKNKPKDPAAIDQAAGGATPTEAVKRKRGRPKGSKNKTKLLPEAGTIVAYKKRGRPPKTPQTVVSTDQETKPIQQEQQLENHPLMLAARWIEKHMHHAELQYYRTRSNRMSVSLHAAIVSDMLGFFNVQDSDICKQIKKNNFLTTNRSYDVHQ
jgi:hypothetical protein